MAEGRERDGEATDTSNTGRGRKKEEEKMMSSSAIPKTCLPDNRRADASLR